MRASHVLGSLELGPLVLGSIALCACGGDVAPGGDGGRTDAGAPDAFVAPRPEITLSVGTVRGARGAGYQAFLGIPYAQPPVGDRRWRAPEPHGGWEGVREATLPGSECPQEALGLTSSGEEDCLFLNVHAPDPLPEAAPVMVWIHGGAFVFGEGTQTDGGTAGDVLAARHGIVVVSMNYRLGVFGFLADDAIGSSGNEGFQDQQLALAWVRDHIADFGGNPDDVTIVGESAGGQSVCLHLIAPASEGLFHRAISQSGLCDAMLPLRAQQVAAAQPIVEESGCGGAADVGACMRGKTLEELRAAGALGGDVLNILSGSTRQSWPNVDGTIVPGQVRDRIAAGEIADVPVMLGWNADEGTLFVALSELQGAVADEATYHSVAASIAAREGLEAADVEAQYPLASYPDPGAAIGDLIGDAELACPSRRAALALAEHGADVRVYHFAYPDAGFQLGADRELGAFHSAEIQFVFGHPSRIGRPSFLGDELALHEAISGYWARFVASADPNGAGATAWPAFTAAGEESLVLDVEIAPGSAIDRDVCALWDSAS